MQTGLDDCIAVYKYRLLGEPDMDGETTPEQLQDRTYYKIGEFVYDNAKVVLVVTMLACVGFASLMFLEPQYVEGFGEGDLESVHGWNALGEGFSDGESGNVEIFMFYFTIWTKCVKS